MAETDNLEKHANSPSGARRCSVAASEVKERPILFCSSMVRAILAGRKTQTRRVIKPQPNKLYFQHLPVSDRWVFSNDYGIDLGEKDYVTCPYGKIGDRLWVRETFQYVWEKRNGQRTTDPSPNIYHPRSWVEYAATPRDEQPPPRWKPSIFMPRKLSRITLKIRGIRVERLQEMSVADAVAEGIEDECGYYCDELHGHVDHARTVNKFMEGWDRLNAKRGYSWMSNPYVWVIEFRNA